MKPITYGLTPFRKDPGHIVQTLPGKRPDGTAVGYALAIVVGAVLAVLLLAVEGSL